MTSPDTPPSRLPRAPRALPIERRTARLAKLLGEDLQNLAPRAETLDAVGKRAITEDQELRARGALMRALPRLDESMQSPTTKPVIKVMLAGAITQIYKASKPDKAETQNNTNIQINVIQAAPQAEVMRVIPEVD